MKLFIQLKEKIWSKTFILLGCFWLLFSACLKEEKPLPPHISGNIETVQIEIKYPYTYQVYYDCESNTILKSNNRYEWDLAFENNGHHIKLNLARPLFIANMGKVDFNSVSTSDIDNATWLWDNESGKLDSLALNSWYRASDNTYSENVYILNRSFNNDGTHLGHYKLLFESVSDTTYRFKYAKLDGSDENIYTIYKSNVSNFNHFSFEQGGQMVKIEPENKTWDLLFTNHQHKFSNLPLPFVLTQCLSNIYSGARTAEVEGGNFGNITLQDTANYTFTNKADEIGYDWKIRNSTDNSYEINPNKFFILRTKVGYYYKIRFIDFYNADGKKGYPKFEIQKL